jgi:hypothetical protein
MFAGSAVSDVYCELLGLHSRIEPISGEGMDGFPEFAVVFAPQFRAAYTTVAFSGSLKGADEELKVSGSSSASTYAARQRLLF